MKVINCSIKDIPELALMNQMLIEDEKAETSLDLTDLQERMTDFITSDYKAFLFSIENKTIGYALCNFMKTPIYLRQFFICRSERRKGYGKKAFQALLDYINIDKIDIDVYVWNESGVAFWESLGFEKRCYNMRFQQHT